SPPTACNCAIGTASMARTSMANAPTMFCSCMATRSRLGRFNSGSYYRSPPEWPPARTKRRRATIARPCEFRRRRWRRSRSRWRKHCVSEKEKQHQKMQELLEQGKVLETGHEALLSRTVELGRERMHFTAQRELVVREMNDERHTLKHEQQRWRRRRSLERIA